METYVKRRASRGSSQLVVTLVLGIGIGFTLCYALFVWGKQSAEPSPTPVETASAPQEMPPIDETASVPAPPPDTEAEQPSVVESQDLPEPAAPAEPEATAPAEPGDDLWAARHLFIAVPGKTLTGEVRKFLAEIKPGGVVLLDDNTTNRDQTVRLVAQIKEAVGLGNGIADLPLVAVGQEGGALNLLRLAEAPSAAEIGARKDLGYARDAGRAVAEACASRGIGVLLGPVLDVALPAANEQTNNRAFGENPQLVTGLGLAFAEGVMSAGVVPVAKYFPGFGVKTQDWASAVPALSTDSLAPFMFAFNEAMASQVPGVQVGNAVVPALDNVPADRSGKVVQETIRGSFSYGGVVLSDDISGATAGEDAVKALQAGCDAVVCLSTNADQVRAVVAAIEAAAANDASLRKQLAESKVRLEAWQSWLRDPAPLKPAQALETYLARAVSETTPDTASTATSEPPEAPETPAPAATTEAAAPAAEEVVHVVAAGEFLAAIAEKHGVTVQQVMEWNNLRNDRLQVGQELKIRPAGTEPAVAEAPAPAPEGDLKKVEYTVKRGDSVYRIALNHGVSQEDVRKWNNLPGNSIDVGQKLVLYVKD